MALRCSCGTNDLCSKLRQEEVDAKLGHFSASHYYAGEPVVRIGTILASLLALLFVVIGCYTSPRLTRPLLWLRALPHFSLHFS